MTIIYVSVVGDEILKGQTQDTNSHFLCKRLFALGVEVKQVHFGKVFVLLFVSCTVCQQHSSVSQGWIYVDNGTLYHGEIEVADQPCCLTLSHYAYIWAISLVLTI